jgi:hypothetical protein
MANFGTIQRDPGVSSELGQAIFNKGSQISAEKQAAIMANANKFSSREQAQSDIIGHKSALEQARIMANSQTALARMNNRTSLERESMVTEREKYLKNLEVRDREAERVFSQDMVTAKHKNTLELKRIESEIVEAEANRDFERLRQLQIEEKLAAAKEAELTILNNHALGEKTRLMAEQAKAEAKWGETQNKTRETIKANIAQTESLIKDYENSVLPPDKRADISELSQDIFGRLRDAESSSLSENLAFESFTNRYGNMWFADVFSDKYSKSPAIIQDIVGKTNSWLSTKTGGRISDIKTATADDVAELTPEQIYAATLAAKTLRDAIVYYNENVKDKMSFKVDNKERLQKWDEELFSLRVATGRILGYGATNKDTAAKIDEAKQRIKDYESQLEDMNGESFDATSYTDEIARITKDNYTKRLEDVRAEMKRLSDQLEQFNSGD